MCSSDLVGTFWKTTRYLATGGDLNGFANPVQRDPVPRRQCLHAADTGNGLVIEGKRALGKKARQDGERAVVQRGVSPDKKSSTFTVLQAAFFFRQPLFALMLSYRLKLVVRP